jgi:hypothetical protein
LIPTIATARAGLAPSLRLADPAIVCVFPSALRFDRGTPREACIPDLTLRPRRSNGR